MKVNDTTQTILSNVQKKLGVKNLLATPRLKSVTVAIGVGSLHTRKGVKDFSEIEKNLQHISGQKPHMIYAKTSISNFKLREGMPSMLKVTLRRQKGYDFLRKVATIVLPRVRDFEGLRMKSFDNRGGYTIGLQSYSLFPEIHPDDITHNVGIQIGITSTSSNSEETKALLQGCGFVFEGDV